MCPGALMKVINPQPFKSPETTDVDLLAEALAAMMADRYVDMRLAERRSSIEPDPVNFSANVRACKRGTKKTKD
jgi:hypothetical protein